MDERIVEGVKKLRALREKHYKIAEVMYEAYGGALYGLDLLGAAVLNRSIVLIEGFCTLVESENYLCAAPLVRFQLDSILRFYAASLVDDPHKFAIKILEGTPVREMKDRNGKRMTDRYLLTMAAELYPWMPRVYDATSGFVHLSNKHILHTVRDVSDPDNVTFVIGPGDEHVPVDAKLEGVEGLLEVTNALFDIVLNWAVTKHDPEGTAKHWEDMEKGNA